MIYGKCKTNKRDVKMISTQTIRKQYSVLTPRDDSDWQNNKNGI
jgi:hypothetical protein